MSVIRSLAVAAVLSASFTGAAFARGEVFTLKLAAPVAEHTQVIALNTVWNCDGDTCSGRPDHAATVRSCRQFIRQAGDVHVVSYGPQGAELSADEIARCNGASATQAAQN